MAAYYARHCREDADDLTQEAWLGVLEALPTLDTRIGDPEQYLLRYARWRLLDAVRKSMQHPLPCLLDEELDGVSAMPPAHQILDNMAISGFLSRLSQIQRAIVACLLAGLTWRETGDKLGCSSANIAYHVRRICESYRLWHEP